MKMMKFAAAATCVLMLTPSMSCVSNSAELSGQNKLSAETISFYDQWKDKYLVKDEYVKSEDQYYVYYSEEKYNGGEYSVPVTVSEAHGYGMLIMASMAEYDSNAKDYFDGMYRFFKAHPSDIGSHLMSWQQSDNGSALIDGAENGSMTGGFCDSATDGDMDIAYSLLMADTIWGSGGEIDYRSEAIAVINDIMKYEVNHEYKMLTLGDWVSDCSPSEIYYSATRCSDFIVQYMPVFAAYTGDDGWLEVYSTTYEIINSFVDEYGTGILPDFVIRDSSGKYVPASADFLESEYDGCYSYNSCRTPWRIGMDYLINGSKDALSFAMAIDNFMMNSTNGDPWEIMAGYTLDGNAVEDYNDLCFTAPLLISSKCSGNQEWHDAVREVLLEYGDDVYYGDTIKMLCLIADDGGWIVPSEVQTVAGDVNADGRFSAADVVMMQKWLIAAPGASLTNWKAGDLCMDNRIDIFDIIFMKSKLLEII